MPSLPDFDAAPFIKDIGRGREHPTDLDFERAKVLWQAVLSERVHPVALGGVLIALRVKGERASEVAGFLAATDGVASALTAPLKHAVPIVIPSYNGARKLPNLTPLLALLLARRGLAVLVHGSRGNDIPAGRPQRVTSAAIFSALGLPACESAQQIAAAWQAQRPAFVDIDTLHPPLARVLAMRAIMGVRNSAHTLVKLLQPMATPAICLSSYTHPQYLDMLSELLRSPALAARGETLLLRATEGEPVANARRALAMQWYGNAEEGVFQPPGAGVMQAPAGLPETCALGVTVRYIEDVMLARLPVPEPIAWQAACIAQLHAVRNPSQASDSA